MNLMTGNISQNEKFIDITDSNDNELDQQSVEDILIGTDDEDDSVMKITEIFMTESSSSSVPINISSTDC
jgi:hypothetical protein